MAARTRSAGLGRLLLRSAGNPTVPIDDRIQKEKATASRLETGQDVERCPKDQRPPKRATYADKAARLALPWRIAA